MATLSPRVGKYNTVQVRPGTAASGRAATAFLADGDQGNFRLQSGTHTESQVGGGIKC